MNALECCYEADLDPLGTRLEILPPQVTVLTAGFPDRPAGFSDLTIGLYDPFAPVRATQPQDDDARSAASDGTKLSDDQERGGQSDDLATTSTSADEDTKPDAGEPERNAKRRHSLLISRESNRPKKLKAKEVKVFVLRPKPA